MSTTHAPHDPDDHIHPAPGSWFTKYVWSTDHKVIGKQYLFTAFIFMAIGGMMAMLIRWKLAYPDVPVPVLGELLKGTAFISEKGTVESNEYLRLVTMHGTIMIFFVIIPLLVGAFGNFLLPLHVGARDVAFPILNALSYWLFLPAGIILVTSFFAEGGPSQAGWTNYPTLSDIIPDFHTGQVLWLTSLFLLGFSSILGGLNFLVTIIKMRAPGMTYSRLPLLTWSQFVTAIFQTLATPVLASALSLMLMDRLFNTDFFRPAELHLTSSLTPLGNTGGGHPLLWQHIFWFYSHPAVYILILPGMGIASELIATFSRKPIFGYKAMAISMCAIMGLGFIVWGHHMFISGMSAEMGRAFMISTMLIALPSGVKVFNWLASLWRGNIRLTTPMLYALSFIALFIIGGLSGLFMAATPVDVHIHDTYYVVAHFHYVVFGGTLFAVFGGLMYWYPKMFGRMMNDFWGKAHWALTFIGFNLAFFPMHWIGEAGAMRRYASLTEYNTWLNPLQPMNVFITWAALLLGAAQIIFILNFFGSLFWGKKAETNPWEANTLEWTLPNPVPYYNFDRVPTVYHGPYEYSSGVSNGRGDWLPQNEPAAGTGEHHT